MSDLETKLTAELKVATERLGKALALLEKIVVPEGEDSGLIWKSWVSPTHPKTLANGQTVQVYDHEHFSELSDALVELWQVLSGQPEEPIKPPPEPVWIGHDGQSEPVANDQKINVRTRSGLSFAGTGFGGWIWKGSGGDILGYMELIDE